ncbi:thiol reductant ABC exporter subunit CydD [Myceligenerans cantabricum]
MRPLDPRLRHVRPARSYLLLTVGLGVASAGLVVALALLVAALLTPAIQEPGTTPAGAGPLLAGLAVVVAGRAVVAWAQERYALRAASRTIADLREQVVEAIATRPPRGRSRGREGQRGAAPAPDAPAGDAASAARTAGTRAEDGTGVATLVTRGLDDLQPYLVRYIPQLVLTALLTPALVVVVLWLDWVSALVVAVTLPLVPIFMVLVGRLTAGSSERRLATVARLGDQVLDLVAGLPTLRAFGRAAGPADRVRALGDASRRATMQTLRVAFLSSMVLELLTTLSVAIVAVGVGLRLVEGQMDLQPAIAVLVLAPEVYLPLRRVGAEFHASVDGVAAASRAFELLGPAAREGAGGRSAAPPERETALGGGCLVLDGVSVRAGDRDVLAPARLSARIPLGTGRPGGGRIVALRGPSGSGKSTTVLVVLGLVEPDSGRVLVETPGPGATTVPLRELGLETWWRHVTWVPQRPAVPPGTIRDILHAEPGVERPAGGASAPPQRTVRVAGAARKTGLDEVVRGLPDGWDTRLGLGGAGLSVGQRQRVALTAALLDDGAARPLVILDEPTAHLDARSEGQVLDTVRAWRREGRTVLVVAHRESLLAIADEVVDVAARPLSGVGPQATTTSDSDHGAAR